MIDKYDLEENAYQYIIELLNRANIISFRIIAPTPEDMKKIYYLYEAGLIIGYTNEYGVPVKKVNAIIDLDSRLSNLYIGEKK